MEFENGDSSPHTRANLDGPQRLSNCWGGPPLNEEGIVRCNNHHKRKVGKGVDKRKGKSRETELLDTEQSVLLNTSPNSSGGRGGPATSSVGDRVRVNQAASNTAPNSLDGRGGPATSSVDDRECINAGEGSLALHPGQDGRRGASHRAFPTNSKEKEKRKEAEDKSKGVEKIVKKKPKIKERHYDDCGNDLRGLGDHLACKCCDEYSSSLKRKKVFLGAGR